MPMSLRTRRSLAIWVSLIFVAAACTGTPAATSPPAATTGPGPTGAATDAPGSPVATEPGQTSGPTDEPGSPEPTADGGIVPGGTLVAGEWQTPANLQPFFSNTFTTSKAVSPHFDGLLGIDNEGNWYPVAATEVPSVENGGLVVDDDSGACDVPRPDGAGPCFTITVSMKPGLLWSDGEVFDLNDFAYTYQWMLDTARAGLGCSGCGAYVLLLPETDLEAPIEEQYALENQYVQGITVSDDGLTATIEWQRKYAGWLGWVSYTILPEHYFSTIEIADGPTSMPMGPGVEAVPASGPFMIVSASSEGIDYDVNPNYSPAPNLESFRYRYFGSKDGMITAFLNGEVDFIDNMTAADFPSIEGVSPDIGTAELHSAWQYEHLDIQNAHVNVGLDDPNVRTAIHHAIDKEDLWNVLFPGYTFEEACTNAPPGTWWRAADVTCPQYDVAEAMRLLDEAGWTVNADTTLREKDVDGDGTNEVMRFQMCTTSGNPTRLTTLGKINGYLAAVGIPSDITTADAGSVYFADWVDTTPETQCSIYRGTYDLALFTYILGGDPGGLYYALYHSSQIPSDDNPNGGNDTRANNEEMDAALEAFQNEVDTAVLLDSARTIQQLYADLSFEIALYYRAEPSGVGRHLGGFLQNPSTAGPFWNVNDWHFIP